jgi:proline dehydrogenase
MPIADLLRPGLLAAGRSARVERAVTRIPVTKHTVDRFVAGTTEEQVVTAAGTTLESGRYISIDYLGEDTRDPGQAADTARHYLQLLDLLATLPVAATSGPRPLEVSLKLSALGQFLPQDGHQIALENAQKICTAAEQAGVWVTVDAEDHTCTDSTLAIVGELRADFPDLGTVLQAYLKRTEADCRDLSGPGSRIRLCKGAYAEPAAVAHQDKDDVNAAFERCLGILMAGQGYPMVASHDPAMIQIALQQAIVAGRDANQFELQMLYGIRDTEQRRIVDNGLHLRTYLPYGDEWFGYFMRRLAERPQNLTFFVRSLTSRK